MYKLIKTSFTTKELKIKNNNIKPGKFKLNPQITRKTGKIKQNIYYTALILKVKSTETSQFPVDLYVDFRGLFEFENIENEENITEFLKFQAVDIMYPYLRSIITNLTTTAMLPPIILPIIDTSKLFNNDRKTTYIN